MPLHVGHGSPECGGGRDPDRGTGAASLATAAYVYPAQRAQRRPHDIERQALLLIPCAAPLAYLSARPSAAAWVAPRSPQLAPRVAPGTGSVKASHPLGNLEVYRGRRGGGLHRAAGVLASLAAAAARRCKRRTAVRASADGEGAEDMEVDSASIESFRQSLLKGWGSDGIAAEEKPISGEWARPLKPSEVTAGDVLLGHPAAFFEDDDGGSDAGPRRIGLSGRTSRGFQQQPPAVLLTRVDDSGAAEGLVLSIRTGTLMGDILSECFQSRPLLYGGPCKCGHLNILHPYKEVEGSLQLSDVGLYLTGNVRECHSWVRDGQGSSFRFRFYYDRVEWKAGELAAELGGPGLPDQQPVWMPARCSADLVLSETGSLDEKPLWLRIAELAGGEVEEVARQHGCMD